MAEIIEKDEKMSGLDIRQKRIVCPMSRLDTLNQSVGQLQKSIRSFDKLIENHKQWIKEPTIKYKNWERMTPKHRKDALYHWEEDMQRAANYKEMAKQVLRRKLEQESVSQEGLKDAIQRLR